MYVISCILLKCMINWWSWKARLGQISALSLPTHPLWVSLLLSYFTSSSWVCLCFLRCYTILCPAISSLSPPLPPTPSLSSPTTALSHFLLPHPLFSSLHPFFSTHPPPSKVLPFIHFSPPLSFSRYKFLSVLLSLSISPVCIYFL